MIKILAFIFIFIVLILFLSINFYKNGIRFDKLDLLLVPLLSAVIWLVTVLIVFMISSTEKIYVDEYHSDNIFDTISIDGEEYFIFSDIDLVIPKDKVSIHTVNSDDSSYRIVESKYALDDNIATSLYSVDNSELDTVYDIYIYIPK